MGWDLNPSDRSSIVIRGGTHFGPRQSPRLVPLAAAEDFKYEASFLDSWNGHRWASSRTERSRYSERHLVDRPRYDLGCKHRVWLGNDLRSRSAHETLVIYWAATLALVGLFFGLLIGAGVQPYASVAQRTVAGLVGALAGVLFGLFVGNMQLRRLLRKSQGSHSGTVS